MLSTNSIKISKINNYKLLYDPNTSSIDFNTTKTATYFKVIGFKPDSTPLTFNRLSTRVKYNDNRITITPEDTMHINQAIKTFTKNTFNSIGLSHKYQNYVDYKPLHYTSKDKLLYLRDRKTGQIIQNAKNIIEPNKYYKAVIHLTGISVKFKYPNEYIAFPVFRIHSVEL